MKFWLKLGYRSLIRNQRRSLLTLSVVALGYCAINLMGGFMHYVFKGLEESFVYAHNNAHLTVFEEGYRTQGAIDPAEHMLGGDELESIISLCRNFPGTVLATPQLQLNGMLNAGDSSTIIYAQGMVTEDAARMREETPGLTGRLKFFEGDPLLEPNSIGVARGLARLLKLEMGSDVILMATTQDGYMNALDATVRQLHDAPMELLDNMYVVLPFELAQQLYDTGGADRILVLLEDGRQLDTARAALEATLRDAGHPVEVATWKELRVAYERIRSMFTVLFSFIFAVVALIVILSIVNTVSTSVVERTREIGTLRAIGLKRGGVVRLFTVENALLGIAGLLVGFLLFNLLRLIIAVVQPTWIPPNIPKRVPWEIAWAPGTLLFSALFIFGCALLAAALPARRVSRTEIIDALGHV